MKSYKDLEVWKKSFNLAKAIYLLSTKLPKTEQFAITSQIQRAAVSIPSNLAEG
jgi:four helix bundle protein